MLWFLVRRFRLVPAFLLLLLAFGADGAGALGSEVRVGAGSFALTPKGGGDPMLTTEGLAASADGVGATGIRRVTGCVRGDDSVFDRQRRGIGWAWDDEAYPYAAPISGLTLNSNTVGVEIRPGQRPGLPPLVRLDPPSAPVALRLRALTGPPGTSAPLHLDRTPGRDEIVVSGRIPWHGEPVMARVSVEDPPLYAAAVFTALLRARGVQIAGAPVALGTPGAAAPLREIHSPRLSEIIREMDKESENLVAETLLKALGMREQSAAAGTGIGGAGDALLRAFLERADLRGPALALADGSGLSRQNLVSPLNLAEFGRE